MSGFLLLREAQATQPPSMQQRAARPGRPPCMCAEHVQQLEGESPLDSLMEVKS